MGMKICIDTLEKRNYSKDICQRYLEILFISFALLICGYTPIVNALIPAQEYQFPPVNGCKIEAIKRDSSVMCASRPPEKSEVRITLLSDTGKYRGGVWYLGVTSTKKQLKPSVHVMEAYLYINGKPVVKGTASSSSGKFVSYEFTAIDTYIESIKSAKKLEIRAKGLLPQKLKSLTPIITAIEDCQKQSSSPDIWKDVKYICN